MAAMEARHWRRRSAARLPPIAARTRRPTATRPTQKRCRLAACAATAPRVRPGQEPAFCAWEQRIATAQAQAPGFQDYRFEPPIAGVQDNWLAILRVDTERNLQAWLDSPQRQRLLEETRPFLQEFHARTVRSGFEQWFPATIGGAAEPVWKQNMIFLLLLYPVVFLLGLWVQTPVLIDRVGLPFWLALFIGNVASVLLLNWMVPWVSTGFALWPPPVRRWSCCSTPSGCSCSPGCHKWRW